MRAVIALFLLVGLLVPSAQAQASPHVRIQVEPMESSLTLDENGRGEVPLSAFAHFDWLHCVQDAQIKAYLRMDAFPKWAGASLEPTGSLTWDVRAHDSQVRRNPAELTFGTAWDVEDAEYTGHHRYTMRLDGLRIEGGPCHVRDPTWELRDRVIVEAWGPPKAEETMVETMPVDEDVFVCGNMPVDQGPVPGPAEGPGPATVPGFGAIPFLASLTAFVWYRRR